MSFPASIIAASRVYKKSISRKKTLNTVSFSDEEPALVISNEFDKAVEECKARVSSIAKDCRAKNKKFRDIEFDIEHDKKRCLHGLASADIDPPKYTPSDVQRVTEIFENPQFFVDGAGSNDIVQGNLGDCWFLSALATMSGCKGLVEKFCVARDEKVGVYGFVFFRDKHWIPVIIDDLLYTSIPKFEELTWDEKQLYHNDKDRYDRSARKGGKTLYFARSGTAGETWVPLIEKAYAKLHGDYHALSGGQTCEAIEDLTGGVSSFIPSKDILDVDQFWRDELLKANKDRLFGCSFDDLSSTRSGVVSPTVNGLFGGHAYSVLRAVECRGKKFVVVRNPWGNSEWTGPWSDGSKEWTKEWLAILDDLDHVFGNDGEFVMEYSDFLNCFQQIDRTLLFDASWVMASQWLHVPARPTPAAWSFGDVSFTFNLPQPTFAVIVLSRLDSRYFNDIAGRSEWTFDFILFRKDQEEPISESTHSMFYTRSVNLETHLDAGDYVLHVRLDRWVPPVGSAMINTSDWDQRKYARVLMERAIGQSIASNFDPK
ncbi:hypothetical protein AX16_004767 [Volvariella volvacea WC 439]|nr:hypothetical protein AX16_004767 [Volvariella volvacea WC 439]